MLRLRNNDNSAPSLNRQESTTISENPYQKHGPTGAQTGAAQPSPTKRASVANGARGGATAPKIALTPGGGAAYVKDSPYAASGAAGPSTRTPQRQPVSAASTTAVSASQANARAGAAPLPLIATRGQPPPISPLTRGNDSARDSSYSIVAPSPSHGISTPSAAHAAASVAFGAQTPSGASANQQHFVIMSNKFKRQNENAAEGPLVQVRTVEALAAQDSAAFSHAHDLGTGVATASGNSASAGQQPRAGNHQGALAGIYGVQTAAAVSGGAAVAATGAGSSATSGSGASGAATPTGKAQLSAGAGAVAGSVNSSGLTANGTSAGGAALSSHSQGAPGFSTAGTASLAPVVAAGTIAFIGAAMASPDTASQPAYFPLKAANCNVAATAEDKRTENEFGEHYAVVSRMAQLLTAQSSSPRLAYVLEKQLCALLSADAVRLLAVQPSGFVCFTSNFRSQGYPGITGHCAVNREAVNLHWPHKDSRYKEIVDALTEERSVRDSANQQPAQASATATGPEALLLMPVECDTTADLRGHRDVVAVIQCVKRASVESGRGGANQQNQQAQKVFSMKETRLVARIAEAMGNVLRNTRSLDRAQELYNASMLSHQRFASVLKVANVLMSENRLEQVVAIIVSQVPELLDSDRCTLFFTDKGKQELIATKGASHGRPKTLVSWIFGQSNAPELPFPEGKNEIRFSMSKGLAGHVARTGETLNIHDAHADPRFNSQIDTETGYKTRNVLCVPMCDDGKKIIGVVQAINKNPVYPSFDEEDEAVLHSFAAQAALAVRNSLLFEKTKTAWQQSDALLEVTKALSSELNIEELLQIIVVKVQKLLSSERCTVFIVDRDNKELYTNEGMSFGMGPALPINHERTTMIRFPMDRGLAGSVATTNQTVNIPDAYADSRFNQQMDKETGFRTRSILCMAIKVPHKNESVGVIQCMNKRSRQAQPTVFDENDEKLLAAFCTQAAVAIENSRLFTQTEKALNHALMEKRNLKFYLSVTKNLVSDMHLNALIEQLTMQVHHLLKADDCALYLVNASTKEYYLAKDENDPHVKRYPFTCGIVGAVAASAHTISISSDAFRDPRFNGDVDQRKNKTTHSILCCAIKAEGPDQTSTVIGVISVRDEKDRGGFEAQEEKLLKVFCAQAAVAIINRRKLAALMDNQDSKDQDRTAADYLQRERGMKIASDDIDRFSYKMEEIELLNTIGSGSYGEVHKAIVRGRVVAVKKLHVKSLKAEQVESFCQEASLMCQLEHPNIVGFVGAVTEPSSLCIITEFCQRGSLADLLLNHNVPMSFNQKLRASLDAALGMQYLHNSNPVILHRDLKSDNLLVDENWNIKVGDFGLTRFLSAKKAMTQVGTPMWMAPEIILGKKYTEKADVYAFGIILWELLTRLEPYEDKEPMHIVLQVVNENLRPMLTPEFELSPITTLMKDCWAAKEEDRPSFDVIVERLQTIMKKLEGLKVDDYGITAEQRGQLKR